MRFLLLFLLLLPLETFAQTDPSHKTSSTGETIHNCDEPCLKCGNKEACKDTKGDDTSRTSKETSTPSSEHKNHQHGATNQ